MAQSGERREKHEMVGPMTAKLGDTMNQGSNGRHPSSNNLPQLLNQGPSNKRSGAVVKKMREILGQ